MESQDAGERVGGGGGGGGGDVQDDVGNARVDLVLGKEGGGGGGRERVVEKHVVRVVMPPSVLEQVL